MPRPIYLLLLLGWASTVGAQEISEDSLRLRLRQARTPEQRAEALFDLGYALHAQHPDSTLAYANQVRELAESVGFVSGLGMAEEMLAQYYLTRR